MKRTDLLSIVLKLTSTILHDSTFLENEDKFLDNKVPGSNLSGIELVLVDNLLCGIKVSLLFTQQDGLHPLRDLFGKDLHKDIL